MSLSIGELVGYVDLDTSGVTRGAAKVDGALGKTRSGFSSLARFAAGALAGVGGMNFLGDALGEATEALKVGKQTEAVIRSTGGAAKVTAGEVGELAAKLSAKAGVDDEAIQSGQNLLLTFKNIKNEAGEGNDIFNQTSAAMVDMSAAMGTDARGAALQLGKALNDPLKGMASLGRAGVQFSESQRATIKRMVESGNVMGAQKMILKELENQFGGSAAAIATPADHAKVAWGNLKETLGTAVLPTFSSLATVATTKVIPAAAGMVEKAKEAGPAFRAIGTAVASVVGWLREHSTVATILAGTIVGLVAVTAAHAAVMAVAAAGGMTAWLTSTKLIAGATKVWTAVQWAMNAALAANPIGLAVVAIAALVAAVIWVATKTEWGRKMVSAAMDGIRSAAESVGTFFTQKLPKFFSDAWQKAKDMTSDGVAKVAEWVRGIPGKFTSGLSSLSETVRGLFRDAMDAGKDKVTGIGGTIVEWVAGIPGKLLNKLQDFKNAGRDLLQGFVDGMKNAAGLIEGLATNVWNAVRTLLNGGIDKINAALEFTINLPGKDLHINPANIPHLATGGRATSETLAVIGEGREPESVLPDSVLRGLLERAHAAGAASAAGGGSGRNAPLIGAVYQQPAQSADELAERLWFKTRTRG